VIRRAARAALALLLCLAAAEATVRAAAHRVPGVRQLATPAGTRVHDPADFAGFRRAYADHLIPHREWRGSRCNALGFHDDDPAPDFPDDGFRVVALGDSFTFGSVPYPQTGIGVAEALLGYARARRASDAPPPPPFAIENLGVPASGIADYRLVHDFVGRGLRPDLVLVQLYLGNDPIDYADESRFGPARATWQRSWLLTFARRAAAVLRERWRDGGGRVVDVAGGGDAGRSSGTAAADPVAHGTRPTWRDDHPVLARPAFSDEAFAGILQTELHVLAKPGSNPDAPDWDAFDAALGGLLDAIAADGTPVALVLAPSRLQVHPDELRATAARSGVAPEALDADLPNRRVAELAARRGVPVIDTTAALRRAAASGERLYLPNDTHRNVRGNAVAGAELALALARLALVPTGGTLPTIRDSRSSRSTTCVRPSPSLRACASASKVPRCLAHEAGPRRPT